MTDVGQRLGRLGPVSPITLGGGGIGGVWGPTSREEAIATIRTAANEGVTWFDMAPVYGTDAEPRRAELLVGEAFQGKLPPDVRLVTKVVVEDDTDISTVVRASLRESMEALRVDHVHLLLHHCDIRPPRIPTRPSTLALSRYRDELRGFLSELQREGLIGDWGLTATGHPEAIIPALAESPTPAAIQTVTNALDSPGSLWNFDEDERPDFAGTRVAASAAGVGVMGIRAAQGGALTDAKRETIPREAERQDYDRANEFRALAAGWGEPAAMLAHRYALSLPNVDTVVIGVKNRAELAECLRAAAEPPLTEAEMETVRSCFHP